MDPCPICLSSYTMLLRRPIECSKCNYTACLSCYRQYFNTSSLHLCINPECNEPVQDETVYKNFPKTYIQKEYNGHNLDRLLDEQKSMIPQTMNVISKRAKIKELEDDIRDLRRLIWMKESAIHSLKRGDSNEDFKEKVFSVKCPGNDCKGFLNSNYKCEVCTKKFCASCLEEKLENHECNPDIVATVKMIKKDSKSCPGCSTLIHRTEGCSQMFCISCHVSFDWNSGKIITKNIHNPHYFEYIRQNNNGHRPRTIGDIPCGGLPNLYEFADQLKRAGNSDLRLQFEAFYQFAGDIRHDKIPTYTPTTNTYEKHLESRILYIKKSLSEQRFKNILKRYQSNERKNHHLCQILVTLATLLEDQMRNVMMTRDHNNVLKECRRIIDYINDCFQKCEDLYQLNLPRIKISNTDRYDGITRSYKTIIDGRIDLIFGYIRKNRIGKVGEYNESSSDDESSI